MSYEPKSLFNLARDKLQSVMGGGVKDSNSLHRWVLLKNSIVRSPPLPPSVPAVAVVQADADSVYRRDEDTLDYEQDTFMFPDPHSLHIDAGDAGLSESQWLDALLAGLEEDEDEDYKTSDPTSVPLPADEDQEPLSPLYSPMSSSDDLVDQSTFYPYPVPYPPLHPPLIPSWYDLDASSDSIPPAPPSSLYDNPFPYCDVDELEDSPVPDAIDDTSDDESDALSTPSALSTSSLSPPGPTLSIPPRERSQLLFLRQVYVASDDSYMCAYEPECEFDSDPLPFPSDTHLPPGRTYHNAYSEC